MFKSKSKKKQEQEEQLGEDIIATSTWLCEDAYSYKLIDGTRFDFLDVEDAAYRVTIAKDLDASPRNWERFQRLVRAFEGGSMVRILNYSLDWKAAQDV